MKVKKDIHPFHQEILSWEQKHFLPSGGVFTKLCHSLILLEKRSPKVLTSSRLMVDQ